MIAARFSSVLFGLTLSGLMSCIVSGTSTLRASGLPPGFVGQWMGSWITAWAVAFPAVLIVAPVTRRLVARLTGT